MARTSSSASVPNFMVQALGNIRMAKRLIPVTSAKSTTKTVTVRKASSNRMPVTAAAQNGLIDHGLGVYEDPKTHSIWYKEGAFLHRRNTDLDKMIQEYSSTIE